MHSPSSTSSTSSAADLDSVVPVLQSFLQQLTAVGASACSRRELILPALTPYALSQDVVVALRACRSAFAQQGVACDSSSSSSIATCAELVASALLQLMASTCSDRELLPAPQHARNSPSSRIDVKNHSLDSHGQQSQQSAALVEQCVLIALQTLCNSSVSSRALQQSNFSRVISSRFFPSLLTHHWCNDKIACVAAALLNACTVTNLAQRAQLPLQPMRPLLLALLQVTSMPLPSPPPPPHTAPDSIAPIDVAETSTPTAALPPPPPSSWGSTDLPLYTQCIISSATKAALLPRLLLPPPPLVFCNLPSFSHISAFARVIFNRNCRHLSCNLLCMSACFGAKIWKVADPWDTCLVPDDLSSMMVGGGSCPHADSAAVAVCAAALVRGIVEGDGDACDSADEITRLADAGARCLHDLLLLLGDVLGSVGSKDGSSLRHCISHSPLPSAITLLLNTMLTLNPPVRARQQAQAEAAGETDATPAAAAADAAAATTGGRLLAAWRQSVLAVRARAINPEDSPLFGLQSAALRVVAVSCFASSAGQKAVRETGCIYSVLNHAHLDELNPTQQEWSIFAVRNLTENCPENQEVIAALQRQNKQSFS